jgi:hypothetical protein
MRCAKAGIACQGYEQEILWVNSTLDHPNVTALSAITDTRLYQDLQHSPSSKNIRIIHQLHAQLSQPLYDAPNFRSRALHILQDIYLPRPYITACDNNSDNHSDPTPSSWIKAVCQMQAPNNALDHSLLAFCAVQVCLSGDSCLSKDEMGQVYNQALSKVIKELDPRWPGNSDETLAAIVVLTTCEVHLNCL